jgi:hypothetical protein
MSSSSDFSEHIDCICSVCHRPTEKGMCHFCDEDKVSSAPSSPRVMPEDLVGKGSLEDNLANCYLPPYYKKTSSMKDVADSLFSSKRTEAHYSENDASDLSEALYPSHVFEDKGPEEQKGQVAEGDERVWLAVFMVGWNFFLIGFAQMLYAKKGEISLVWDTGHWFLFLLISLPCLYFGLSH